MEEQMIDAAFALNGETIPLDHGYLLFSAAAALAPVLHEDEEARAIGVHPVFGMAIGEELKLIPGKSALKLRAPIAYLPKLLPLAGKRLVVGAARVTVGAPSIYALEPRAALRARMVTIKDPAIVRPRSEEKAARDAMTLAVRKQLAALPLQMDSERIEVAIGRRHVLRVGGGGKKSHLVVGFEVGLDGLEAEASLVVQGRGIGGRRHMGCGLFGPGRPHQRQTGNS